MSNQSNALFDTFQTKSVLFKYLIRILFSTHFFCNLEYCVKMIGFNREKLNNLRRKIEQCVRKYGFDENFVKACIFNLEKVKLQFEDSDIKNRSPTEDAEILMSYLFIDLMELYPIKRFQCQTNELSSWPLLVLPSEIFAKDLLPDELRKVSFYECLRIGDCLECRMSVNLPIEYRLRVIHKYGVTRILDDLNIIVMMRKADISELPLPLREFPQCALIRVVVTEKEENEVHVSVIDNNPDFRIVRPQLGAIPDTHVPQYVLDPGQWDKVPSFKDYLSTSRAFYDPVILNDIYKGFGINPRGTYSCFPINHSLNFSDLTEQLNELKLSEAHDLMEFALVKQAERNFKHALDAISKAISIHPKVVSKKDKENLSNFYEIKANILMSEDKPLISKRGLEALLKAFNIDDTNESAKVGLSRRMFRLANIYYKEKDFDKAVEWASMCLKLNENVKARNMMEYLKKKNPETTVDCDEISLQALLEKKKALGSELKKLSREEIEPLVPY